MSDVLLRIPSSWGVRERQLLSMIYEVYLRRDPVMMYFLNQVGLLDAEQYLYAVGEKRALQAEVRRLRLEVEELRGVLSDGVSLGPVVEGSAP